VHHCGMSGVSVGATMLPLAGVIVGAIDVRRDALQRAAAQRAERKEAIIGFLNATDRIEQHWERLAAHNAKTMNKIAELLHNMWLAKNIIGIVYSGELAQAAHDYALELNRLAQEWRSTGQSSREVQPRTAFLEAARREMGYTGEPLKRRTLRADHLPTMDEALSAESSPVRVTANSTTTNPTRPVQLGQAYPEIYRGFK
jgi:hypothetical protein